MRYLDIAIAALIGASVLSTLSVWTPRLGDAATSQLILKAQLRDQILTLLQQRGIFWLLRASPQSVCEALSKVSTPVITYTATIGSISCGYPPNGEVFSSIVLQQAPYEVSIGAWSPVPR